MRLKLTFATGFAVGYLLGARAGRERYEQLTAALRSAAESPVVQSAAGVLRAQLGELGGSLRHRVNDEVAQRLGGHLPADGSPYPGPFTPAGAGGPDLNGGPH